MTPGHEGQRREWWVFYIDPTEPQGSEWRTAGMISGRFSADEAIMQMVGRRFPEQPFWAFALDKGEFGAYYNLHYAGARRLGPSGYVAEGTPSRKRDER